MEKILQIDDEFIEENTDFNTLIAALKSGFTSQDILVPLRHHHDFPNPAVGAASTLLLMPAWHPSQSAGVKIVTVSPQNGQFNLPSIQGTYIYFDATNGTIKAILEAKSLTAKRTAAASALASSFLSKTNASSLLMIGTGALAPNLIKAHAAVRPIEQVFVWGRNLEKANTICRTLQNENFTCKAIDSFDTIISEVDIISCATLSKTPLIKGEMLRAGQHLDLVGAYKKDTREADSEAIVKSAVYLDSYHGGLNEAGDIVIPLNEGLLSKEDIKADLFELCSGTKTGRKSDTEITLFKSVGHALEDLIAAEYFYQKIKTQ